MITLCKALAKLTVSILSALTILDAVSPQLVEARSSEVVQEFSSQPTYCTDATLKGAYGYIDSGFQGTQAPFVPYNAVRTANFDGNGNFQGQGYLSLSGVIKQYSATGTYKVDNDCTVQVTATLTFSDGTTSLPASQFGVIVDGGKKVLQIQTTSGRNESGSYEKVRK